MRLKAVVPSSYNLNSRWVVKQKYSNCQWTWTPWFDPRVPLMCNSRDFRQGMGGGIVLSFLFADSAGPDLAWQIQTVWNSDSISDIFFSHIHFLETKAPIRPAVHMLVWSFVVPMYQRRISRDKVHILKMSRSTFVIPQTFMPRGV